MSPAWLAVSCSAASRSSLQGRVPPPEALRDDPDARAVHPLDHVGAAVLLVDHGRVVLADQLVLVQLLDSVQLRQRPRPSRTPRRRRPAAFSHPWLLPCSGYPMDESRASLPSRAPASRRATGGPDLP